MIWTTEPGHGFTTGQPWIAFGAEAATTNRQVEEGDPGSMLSYYRQLLELRRGRQVWGTGQASLVTSDVPQVLAFTRDDDFMRYAVAVNMTDVEITAKLAISDVGSDAKLVVGQGTLAPTADDGTAEVSLPPSESAIWRTR